MSLDPYTLLQIVLRIGAAVGVFLFGRWLARRARAVLSVALTKTTLAPSMVRLLLLAAYYGILLVAVVLALALIGFPIETLLTASLIIVLILGLRFSNQSAIWRQRSSSCCFSPFVWENWSTPMG